MLMLSKFDPVLFNVIIHFKTADIIKKKIDIFHCIKHMTDEMIALTNVF